MKIVKTYSFRIKDSVSKKKLEQMARSVNFVWNYCNEASIKSIDVFYQLNPYEHAIAIIDKLELSDLEKAADYLRMKIEKIKQK